jgi:hypothetical protein
MQFTLTMSLMLVCVPVRVRVCACVRACSRSRDPEAHSSTSGTNGPGEAHQGVAPNRLLCRLLCEQLPLLSSLTLSSSLAHELSRPIWAAALMNADKQQMDRWYKGAYARLRNDGSHTSMCLPQWLRGVPGERAAAKWSTPAEQHHAAFLRVRVFPAAKLHGPAQHTLK